MLQSTFQKLIFESLIQDMSCSKKKKTQTWKKIKTKWKPKPNLSVVNEMEMLEFLKLFFHLWKYYKNLFGEQKNPKI